MKITAQTGWYLRRADVPLPALTFGVLGVKGIFVRALIPLLLKGSPDTQNVSVSHLSALICEYSHLMVNFEYFNAPRIKRFETVERGGINFNFHLDSIVIRFAMNILFLLRENVWSSKNVLKSQSATAAEYKNFYTSIVVCHCTIVKICLQDF